jgi:hypothetical protein
MDSILQNLSHETEPSAHNTVAPAPAPQRKLTIRLPVGSNNSYEAAAPTAPRKDVDAILKNLAGYRPPPPGPQLFGPPPKARAKPTLQRTTPRAPDAGPLPSILELLEQHVAARPTSEEAPPTAEETLAALGAPGDDEAPPTAPPTAEEAMEALGVPRYVRDALRAPPTAEEATEDVRDAAPPPPARKKRRLSGFGSTPKFPAKLMEMVSRHADVVTWENNQLVVRDPARLCAELMPRYFTVKTGTATFPSFARQLNYYGFSRAKTGADLAYVHPGVVKVEDLATLARKDEPARKKPKAAEAVEVVSVEEHRRVVAERDMLREEVSKLRKALAQAEAALPIHTAEAIKQGDLPDPRLYLADSATSNDVCAFCGKHHGTPNADGTLEGDLLFPPFRGSDGKPVWVHAQCALFSAEVHGEREGDLYNVLAAVKRGRSLKCAACGERGATVGCGEKRCSKSFHLRCAAAHGLLQGETTFHCRKHASWPDAVQCDRCFKWRAWKTVDPTTGRPAPLPEGDWFCELNQDTTCNSCEVKASIPSPEAVEPDKRGDAVAIEGQKCAFCLSPSLSLLESKALGGLCTRPLKDGPKSVFHHAACLALAPEVVRSGGHVFRGLSALRRGRLLKCFACGKRGATVGCGVKECPRSFHAPCALFRSGGCVDEGNGESSNVFYCSAHRNKGTDRWVSCGACSAWRRWTGPVDATGEPLLAPDAQPTCAELGSACDAPPDELQGGEVELTEGVAAAAPAVGVSV